MRRERGLSMKLFIFGGKSFGGNRKAASAMADTRLLGALNTERSDQAHTSHSATTCARGHRMKPDPHEMNYTVNK